jgi:hypothetical protein
MTMQFKSADDGDKKAGARRVCIYPRSTFFSRVRVFQGVALCTTEGITYNMPAFMKLVVS